MRSIENMVYGVNANGAKYGNSMIVDYLGRTIALAARGRQMTIGATIDIDEMREYRNKIPEQDEAPQHAPAGPHRVLHLPQRRDVAREQAPPQGGGLRRVGPQPKVLREKMK
jgi:hypothetical protein